MIIKRNKALSGFSLGWACACLSFTQSHAGSLSGAYTPLASASTINLTAEGLIDWAHWGQSAPTDFNHKAGITPQITDFVLIGEGPVLQFDDNFTAYSWTNGTPTARATRSTSGIYVVNEGNGFQISVPADTTVKTLKVYVGVYAAQMRFEAALSDNSAPAYVDESFANDFDGPNRIYTLNFAASSAGQTLSVKFVVLRFINDFANVTLQAAVLREGAPLLELTKPTSGAIFYAATNGIQFRVSTFSPNTIPTNQIRLFLNDEDVSSMLAIIGTDIERSATYSDLLPNLFYRGQISVADNLGQAATNNFIFDTFSTNGSVVIEVEDYNYGDGLAGGLFQNNPPPSGFDANQNPVGGLQPDGTRLGYLGAQGVSEVDFFDLGTGVGAYRDDPVGTEVSSDLARGQYVAAGVADYVVSGWEPDEWLNYTRDYSNGNYYAYLRYAALEDQTVRLDKVVGNPAQPNPLRQPVGIFYATRTGNENSFRYAPLSDALGNLIALNLSGRQALRLTGVEVTGALRANFLLLAPASGVSNRLPALTFASPAPEAVDVAPDTKLVMSIQDRDSAVVAESIRLLLDGADVTTASTVFVITTGGATIIYQPPALLPLNSIHQVEIIFSDNASPVNVQTNQWSFTVAALPVIPAAFGTAPGSGRTNGFNIRIHQAPADSDPSMFTNSSSRAELQIAGRLINPATSQSFVNEAAGPNGDGTYEEPGVINYDENATETGYFLADAPFPGVPADSPDFMAMEATAYVELTAGVHRFGVRSDDGFKLAAGPSFTNTPVTLGVFEGGRGNALPDGSTEFEFLVESNGVYAVSLIWYEGTGGANIEWFSVDRSTLASTNIVRTLINGSASANSIKAYRSRAGSPTSGPTAPQIQSPVVTGGNFQLSFATQPGFNYTVEFTESLSIASWQKISPSVPGDGSVKTVSQAVTGASSFYRVVVE